MRSADHPRLGVCEQHRGAIRGENSEQQARSVGHDCIGDRPFLLGPGPLGADHLRRVPLVNGRELGSRKHRRNGPAAVLVDRGAVVAAAVADVEAGRFPG